MFYSVGNGRRAMYISICCSGAIRYRTAMFVSYPPPQQGRVETRPCGRALASGSRNIYKMRKRVTVKAGPKSGF